MYRVFQFLIPLILVTTLTSCDFISNSIAFKNTTEEFTESLINEDYDKCIQLFALEHEIAQNLNLDTLRSGLPRFRNIILENFGDDLQYTLMSSQKTFSTIEGNSTPPNTTKVLVQFANQEAFGVMKVLFDDHSKKILNIYTEEAIQQV